MVYLLATYRCWLLIGNHSLGDNNNFCLKCLLTRKSHSLNLSTSELKFDFHAKYDYQILGSRKDGISFGGNPHLLQKGDVSNKNYHIYSKDGSK